MSVPKSKRTISNMEFFHNAIELRKYITLVLLKDFGIKTKIRNLKYIASSKHMTDEDRDEFMALVDKYGLNKYGLDVYPEWLISRLRDNVYDLSYLMMNEIVRANSIYVNNPLTYQTRRIYQNNSIIICEQLLQQFEFAIDILDVDANKYMYVTNKICHEIGLLKRWRTADKQRFEKELGPDISQLDIDSMQELDNLLAFKVHKPKYKSTTKVKTAIEGSIFDKHAA